MMSENKDRGATPENMTQTGRDWTPPSAPLAMPRQVLEGPRRFRGEWLTEAASRPREN